MIRSARQRPNTFESRRKRIGKAREVARFHARFEAEFGDELSAALPAARPRNRLDGKLRRARFL